jgi:hypothetical protein
VLPAADDGRFLAGGYVVSATRDHLGRLWRSVVVAGEHRGRRRLAPRDPEQPCQSQRREHAAAGDAERPVFGTCQFLRCRFCLVVTHTNDTPYRGYLVMR